MRFKVNKIFRKNYFLHKIEYKKIIYIKNGNKFLFFFLSFLV